MTRTDVMASSRPQTADAKPKSEGSATILHGFSAAAVALLVALALLPAAALAAVESPTSGYNQEPNTTKTTTTKPATSVSPSKESAKPTAASEPTPTTTTAKASTLPFTGFDLRWDIGFALLAMGAGFSILAMLRRQRR